MNYGHCQDRLRLFDLSDDSLVPVAPSGNFDKPGELAKNLASSFTPTAQAAPARLLATMQEYFVVSNAAQLILDETVERGSNLHDLPDYAVVRINDAHTLLGRPELVRLLVDVRGFEPPTGRPRCCCRMVASHQSPMLPGISNIELEWCPRITRW